MSALFNYPGAKWGMAKQICSMMPAHRSYLEPYFGSGAVLFNKQPSAIETVNDIDGDIVNFFTVLREQPDELARLIYLTPYARDVFNDAHHNRGTDPLDRAYRFAIRSKMGFGFKTYTHTGFKVDIAGRQGSYAVRNWAKMPELVRVMLLLMFRRSLLFPKVMVHLRLQHPLHPLMHLNSKKLQMMMTCLSN